MKTHTTLLTLAALSLSAFAADVTGTWKAELKEGKVEGDTVTFVEPLKIQDNELRITYTGKISGNEIKFTRKVGDFGSSEATAKREGGAPGQRGQGGRGGFGGPI